MAESSAGSGEGNEEGGNWWAGWVQAAKDKSAQTYEYIKKDLTEFKNICATETSSIVASTSHTLQETMNADHAASSDAVKKGITNILGGITNMLTIPPEDDDDDTVLRVSSSGNLEVFDKAKARLYEIQTSVQTYCTEPDGSNELFEEWKLTFDLEAKKADISDLLVSLIEVRSIYTKLVPSAVSHSDFWERYYYKVHQLDQDERRKAELKTRADIFQLGETSEQQWEDDWEDDSTVNSKTLSQLTNQKPSTQVTTPPSTNSLDNSASSSNEPMASGVFNKTEDSKSTETLVEPLKKDVKYDEIKAIEQSDDSKFKFKQSALDDFALGAPDVTLVTVQPPKPNSGSTSDSVEDASKTSDIKMIVDEASSSSEKVKYVQVKEKGDYMMVGSDRTTPASSVSSAAKENESSSGLDDEWDKELFGGADPKAVRELAEKLNLNGDDPSEDGNGWDSWE